MILIESSFGLLLSDRSPAFRPLFADERDTLPLPGCPITRGRPLERVSPAPSPLILLHEQMMTSLILDAIDSIPLAVKAGKRDPPRVRLALNSCALALAFAPCARFPSRQIFREPAVQSLGFASAILYERLSLPLSDLNRELRSVPNHKSFFPSADSSVYTGIALSQRAKFSSKVYVQSAPNY